MIDFIIHELVAKPGIHVLAMYCRNFPEKHDSLSKLTCDFKSTY